MSKRKVSFPSPALCDAIAAANAAESIALIAALESPLFDADGIAQIDVAHADAITENAERALILQDMADLAGVTPRDCNGNEIPTDVALADAMQHEDVAAVAVLADISIDDAIARIEAASASRDAPVESDSESDATSATPDDENEVDPLAALLAFVDANGWLVASSSTQREATTTVRTITPVRAVGQYGWQERSDGSLCKEVWDVNRSLCAANDGYLPMVNDVLAVLSHRNATNVRAETYAYRRFCGVVGRIAPRTVRLYADKIVPSAYSLAEFAEAFDACYDVGADVSPSGMTGAQIVRAYAQATLSE